jgi:hypothetical protein
MDPIILAATCVNISLKQNEVSRKTRDIVNAVYFIRHQDYLLINDSFWNLKHTLNEAEMIILRELRFNTVYHSPLTYLACFYSGSPEEAQVAWDFIGRLVKSPAILDYLILNGKRAAECIAWTAIYFAKKKSPIHDWARDHNILVSDMQCSIF